MKDFYKILGVDPKCTQSEIKSAYKKMAKEHHPDNGGMQEKMQEINEAWDHLKSPEKRQEYDFSRNYNFFQGPHNPFRYHPAWQARRNADVNVRLILSLEDIYQGKEMEIDYRLPEGTIQKADIKIKAGTPNGARIKFSGLGSKKILDIEPGNLYIQLQVQQHPVYSLHGNQLLREVDVDVFDVMLSRKPEIECLDGSKIKITLPEGASSGAQLRIKGKGLPKFEGNGFHDLILILNVKTRILTEEQKTQMEKIL